MSETSERLSPLAPYLPRLVRLWSEDSEAETTRALDGSLVSIDISGFTALAERLAVNGKAGAEELVQQISSVFDALIAVAERHGGDVLKFRGDALLLFFTGERHAERATGAASDMQWTIEEIGDAQSSVGPVELRMSAGVHSALCHFFLTAEPHRELIVAGPAATRVFQLEDLATAGEIVVSGETAAQLDPSWLADERDGARVITRLAPGASTIPPPPEVPGTNLEQYVPQPLRDHLAVASGEAEHRQVTVAFLKLSGTDDAAESGALPTMLDQLAAAVGRACSTYGLTWLESDIDVGAVKLYLTGGAPSSSGDDEEGMLRALRDVIAACPTLPLRAGVNRGHVFTGDIGNPHRRTYAVMGDAVNLAARLTARAQPGRIVATADVLDRAGTVYATETEPLLVKGKEQAVLAHTIGEPVGRRPAQPPDPTPIVGRDAEVELLRRGVDLARMRQLQVIELVGEPGIGKSRLVQELRSLALGFQQLEGAAEHYSSSEPFAALRPLLRQLVGITPQRSPDEAGDVLAAFVTGAMPDLAPWLPLLAIPFDARVEARAEVAALDAMASRDKLHWAVETFLERILMMPTLVVIEDAHWLDDASRFLLTHLVAQPAPRPWVVCVTTRPGSDPIAPTAEHGARVELEPIAGAAAEELAIAVASQFALSVEAVEALAERSGGNPLFVRELVFAAQHGAALEDLPETVESLLTARIDTLDPADRMLLRYAAVIGPSFELGLLGEILDHELPDAGRAVRWAPLTEFVVAAEGDSLGFRHDLVRATAYEGLSFRRRRDIHGRVGAALERRAGDRAEEEAALLSLHFFEAGDNERAWHYAVLAGRRAEAGFSNAVAAELYDRALAAAAKIDGIELAEVAAVSESLGDVCERFAAFDRAEAAYGRVHELGGADPLVESRICAKQGALLERAGRYDDAVVSFERGIAELSAVEQRPEALGNLAELELGIAGVSFRRGAFDDAIGWAAKAAANAEAFGDRGRLAHAYYLTAAAYNELGLPDGISFCELALPIYRELNDARGESSTLNNLGIRLYYESRWNEAVEAYRGSAEAARRAGDVIAEAIGLNNEAELLSDQGHYELAEHGFQHMHRVARAARYAGGAAVATINLARVAARSGRFVDADGLYAEGLAEFEEIGSRSYLLESKARLTELRVFEGRHAEALELGRGTLADDGAVGVVRVLLERMIGYALHQARQGDEVLPHLEASVALAREVGSEYETAISQRALAEVSKDATLLAQSDAALARLGVVAVPRVPLP